MKIFIYSIILFKAIITPNFAQDSTFANAKFNFYEFNINSSNYIKLSYNKPLSFNSANIGVKMGLLKLSFGAEYSPNYNSGSQILPQKETSVIDFYNLNLKSNLFIYFNKNKKKFNPFVLLNYNTQMVKDFTDFDLNYRKIKGNAYGLGFGSTFYIKKSFLIEPSILANLLFFKDKNIYKTVTYLTTTYTEETKTSGYSAIGISLKIGYIIPFKNK